MSNSPGPKTALISEAQGLLGDTDPNRPIVSQTIWDSAINGAARDLSRYAPLRKLIPVITVNKGDLSAPLPSDFLEIDVQSFNSAINPLNYANSYNAFIFSLSSISSASGGFGFFSGTDQPFQPGTNFEFTDDGAGGKLFTWDQPVQLEWQIQFACYAQHSVTDAGSTVPEQLKDVFLLKVCEYACRALSRQLAGDRYLNEQYGKLADGFCEEFENRTKFRPSGRAG